MRRPGHKNRKRSDGGVPVVGSSHIGFQVLHEHEQSAMAKQDGIHSRWHQHAAVDGDLPPAKPARNDAGNPVPNCKKANQDENWKRGFFRGDGPPSALAPVARPVGQRESAPRLARPKWLTQVFQPAPTLDAPTPTRTSPVAASSKKEFASTLSSRQQQQRKDMPDCQPSRPVRQRSGEKWQAVLSSDASNTHATEDITDHDDDDDPDDHDDDISDITPEDYGESIISDSQSYIRRNNNSKSIPQEVSASKALDSNHDSNHFPKTTRTVQPVVDTKNTAPVSSIEDPEENRPALASSTSELEPVDAAREATAAKYRKMLQMQVPKEAVRQKMMVDGVDPEIVRLVVGESALAILPAYTKKDRATVALSANKNKTTLTDQEELVALPYRSMLQLRILKARVSQKMQQEGIDGKIIAAVVGDEPPVQVNAKDDSKNENKLVSLHWTPLSGKDLDHSVWMANNRQSMTAQSSDFTKLVELFKKKPKTCLPMDGKKLASKSRSPPRANLLDLSRCNNVAISLKQFKEFSHEDLRDIIAFLDPMQRIRGERVEFLRDILPTASESRKVEAYDGIEDCLVSTEIWFRRVACIQRLERKVEVIRSMEVFTSETAVLDKKLRLLSQVCHQVMSSEKLQHLLDMVLQVGNTLNAGTRTGGAAGFKFDSLLKLTQTKSSDGKITVLDFVVALFATHGQRDSLKLLLDFPNCHAAARLPVSDLANQVTTLQRALQICEDELKALKDELSGRGIPRQPKGKTTFRPTKKSESDDARGNLMASLLSRSQGNAVQEQKKLSTSSKAIECGDSGTQAIDATASNFDQNSLQGGIVRLEAFIHKGKETLVELDSSRNVTLDACSSLSKYCGECGAATASSTLLGILAQFASNVDVALIKFDRQQKAETRRQKTQLPVFPVTESGEAPPTSSSDKADESSGEEKSLVLLVNEWLNDANDRTIAGGMHVNEKLNAIYDKEKAAGTSTVVGARSAAPWRSDLVMERDGKMEQ
jgi:hypothetical protein